MKNSRKHLLFTKSLSFLLVSFAGIQVASAAFQSEFDTPEKIFENATENPKTRIKTVQTQCSAYPEFALVTTFKNGIDGDRFLVRTRAKNMTNEQLCSSSFKGASKSLPDSGWFLGVKKDWILFRDKGSGATNQFSIVDAKSGTKLFTDSYLEKQGIEVNEVDTKGTLQYYKVLDTSCNPVQDKKCYIEVRSKYNLPNEVTFEEPECRNLSQSAAADSGPSSAVFAAPAKVKDLREPKAEIVSGRIVCSPKI